VFVNYSKVAVGSTWLSP